MKDLIKNPFMIVSPVKILTIFYLVYSNYLANHPNVTAENMVAVFLYFEMMTITSILISSFYKESERSI